MSDVLEYRFVEAMALLPMLHMPAKRITAAVVGPNADLFTAEILRWPEVVEVYSNAESKDKRVKAFAKLDPNTIDLMVLSPEQDPAYWYKAMKADGVMNVATFIPSKWAWFNAQMRGLFGNAVPWREYLPRPVYGILASQSRNPPARMRSSPCGARRLHTKYLPNLFTFAKDELPLAFSKDVEKIQTP